MSRIDELLAELTLEEKAAVTAGVDMWHGAAVDRVRLPALKVTDGPVGARGARWVGTRSACGPCGSALGATWNPDRVREVGRVLGSEARAKRANVLLAPTVNLHRSPLAGRNFECYSEDPHLSAALAVAFVEGVQSTGVGACIKHFVANDSEYQRHTISSEVGERTLRELLLVPFEAAVEAGVFSVMSAYNRLNGTYCAEHTWLLRDVLKGEWGFDGVVMSDWWGTQSERSVEGGQDLEMPGPARHTGATTAQRVRDGELDESVLDEQVRRLLLLAERTGVFSNESTTEGAGSVESDAEDPAHRPVLRRAATEAIVCLRNDPVEGSPLVPLPLDRVRRLAVVGPNAAATALLGGGSAAVNLHRTDSILDGLLDALAEPIAEGRLEVVHEPGVDSSRTARPVPPAQIRPARPQDGPSGVTVEYFANRELAGDPVLVESHADTKLMWMDDDAVPSSGFSVRITGTFTATVPGAHTFGLVTGGTGRLLLDGEVALDNTEDRRPGTSFFGLGSEEIRTQVDLTDGQEVELVGEFRSFRDLAVGALLIGMVPPVPDDALDRAVRAAADADAVVLALGLNADWETEGEDRASMALPGGQDELARRVIEANPRTVVLVNAGAPVLLDGTEGAPALLQTWYLGQETAGAVADVLLGAADTTGRLPTTLGRREEDWPSFLNYPGDAGKVLYGEELLLGYRGFDARGTEPAFPFGHGLSTTSFSWSEPALSASAVGVGDLVGATPLSPDAAGVDVTLRVTNTGPRAGADVVQVYVTDPESTLRRPERELRGFAKVHLEPGGTADVRIALGRRAFAAWDPEAGDWTVEPGRFLVHVARSSRDVHATLEVDVTAPEG
ncbi:glycoside hydrolase family 3 protein [Dermatobacter hominis]|uniref:glycoside hydrolase family 3 protein n=1 Tax=Dermatobacter hominis TaxID=2884263 RepID=UPI001D111411|nr:glycoside hydrolase family 3 N-terminal domain-containing protein [Dermatobacter hominis]UDY36354.1 glycoside hydrolase family 3 C-terminal domain-containing protein [Dermatobacter hominis]